jgi:hypothetical protein
MNKLKAITELLQCTKRTDVMYLLFISNLTREIGIQFMWMHVTVGNFT